MNVCWLIREVGWPHCFGSFSGTNTPQLEYLLALSPFPFLSFPFVRVISLFPKCGFYFPCSFDYSVLQSIVFLRHPKATELLHTLVGWSLLRLSRYFPPIWLLDSNLVWIKEKKQIKTSYLPPSTHTQHTYTMRSSTFLVSSLAVFGAHAAPALPKLDLDSIKNPAVALDAVSSYFNLLASKVQLSKVQSVAPVCDLSKAQMPTSKSPSWPCITDMMADKRHSFS